MISGIVINGHVTVTIVLRLYDRQNLGIEFVRDSVLVTIEKL